MTAETKPPSFEVQGYAMAARLLFPPDPGGEFPSIGDYTPIINVLGETLFRYDSDGYEGDTMVLLVRDQRFGLLVFGWGSCSGCDTLQACQDYTGLGELIFSLEAGIRWFDTMAEAKAWIGAGKDDEADGENNDWYKTSAEWKTFQEGVAKL